jgi:hypothetical protein
MAPNRKTRGPLSPKAQGVGGFQQPPTFTSEKFPLYQLVNPGNRPFCMRVPILRVQFTFQGDLGVG